MGCSARPRHIAPACSDGAALLVDTLSGDASRDVSAGRPVIQWYPGHIAKAERLMSEVLSMVDVVVELRDSRVPSSTTHPSLPTWIGSRGHVLVLNRVDSVPAQAVSEWQKVLLDEEGMPAPHFVDAKQGKGIADLKRAIIHAGRSVNERRKRRGINPRPVRAAILGRAAHGTTLLSTDGDYSTSEPLATHVTLPPHPPRAQGIQTLASQR
jgi:hypothetical protein